jgi:hypothetical protein
VTWTRVTDVDEAATFLPAWIGRRLVGLHGRFGLLLTTGDVLRITSIGVVHHSSDGVILVDVSLDNAGVPEGADLAWRSKHSTGCGFLKAVEFGGKPPWSRDFCRRHRIG